ncbi:MAG: V-type ATP synthase subunit I [Enterococcus sp.]
MAVAEMNKVTLITDKRHQESLLQAIQSLQNVEIRDLWREDTSNQWVNEYFPNVTSEESKIENGARLVMQINEAIQFVERYGDSRQKKQHLKRQEISLRELEDAHHEERFTKELSEILALKEQFLAIQAEKKQLVEQENWLNGWQYLDASPSQFSSKKTKLILGSISSANAQSLYDLLDQEEFIYRETIYQSATQELVAVVLLNNQAPKISEQMNRLGFVPTEYTYEEKPKDVLAKVKKNLHEQNEQEKQLIRKIGEKSQFITKLEWAEEVLLARNERERIKERLIQEKYLIVIQGWLDTMEKELFLEKIAENFPDDDVYLSFEEPTTHEITKEIPTKLRNHPLVRPFEMLTEMYSLPKYNEIDPTPWMAPFYFVFFGMMVADIGYGLLMLIGTIIAQRVMVLPRGLKRFTDFFKILSIPTIIWGFIYSSFFGAELPKEVFGIHLPFPILSTTDDVNSILILSVVFGLIQILVGLFVAGKEHIKRKEYLSAISNGFAWQGILVGIGLAVVGSIIVQSTAILYTGVVVAILSALCILAIPIIQSQSKIKGVAKGAYSLYGITSYIGDLVSYTRLMALGISGGSIAAAFNMLVEFMPPAARFTVGIVLLIALHALNLFLSLLSAYVHGARLQYVEFFGKFYTGGGRAFEPLKTKEKHVNINENHKK